MEKETIIHTIATNAPLDKVLSYVKDEYLAADEGHLVPEKEDDALLSRLGHTLRRLIEVSLAQRNRSDHLNTCPHCGSTKLDYKEGNGGDQITDLDGNAYQYYTAKCQECGKTVYQTAQYIGVFTEQEFRMMTRKPLTSPFETNTLDSCKNPFEILSLVRSVKPETVKKARGVSLSLIKENDATFEDILTSSDGTLLCLFRWKDDPKNSDVTELTQVSDNDLRKILEEIEYGQ